MAAETQETQQQPSPSAHDDARLKLEFLDQSQARVHEFVNNGLPDAQLIGHRK